MQKQYSESWQRVDQANNSTIRRHAPNAFTAWNPMAIDALLNGTDSISATTNRHNSPQPSASRSPAALAYRLQRSSSHSQPTTYHYIPQVGTEPPSRFSARTLPPKQRRPSRPKYSEEEKYFIWYWRTDMSEDWPSVLRRFNQHFPGQDRSKGGLQCAFYRLLGHWNVEKVREQNRQSQRGNRDMIGKWGVVQRTGLQHRWRWMRPEDQHKQPILQFEQDSQRTWCASPCSGCDECRR